MSMDYYSVLAGGQSDIQDVPATSSEDRVHVLSRDCWCKPTIETVDAQKRVKHRTAKS